MDTVTTLTSQVSVTALTANPTPPPFPDDQKWITAYMDIHAMSPNSSRVAYLLWFFVAAVFLVASCARQLRVGGSFLGACWSKWATRRLTWRKHRAVALAREGRLHRQPLPLPPNAQLLSLLCLFVVALVLSFVGPDYIAPQVGLFSFVNNSPVANAKRTSYEPSQFNQYQPQYTIPKAWWTVGGRTGIIAFALLPLCVLFALKSPPFALFSIPFTTQLHFDKLFYIHRWSGRLIWLVTALHVAAWSVQLAKDRSMTNKTAYTYAWHYEKFINGWIVSRAYASR
jgi:Ferric reductase like transmembrane component